MIMTHLASILLHELAELIESSEIFSEDEYNTRYENLVRLINQEGGFE
jgi:hypothetical protein